MVLMTRGWLPPAMARGRTAHASGQLLAGLGRRDLCGAPRSSGNALDAQAEAMRVRANTGPLPPAGARSLVDTRNRGWNRRRPPPEPLSAP
jgi:hypothetical protein